MGTVQGSLVRLLEADPDLGRFVEDRIATAARRRLVIDAMHADPGPWAPTEDQVESPSLIGFLILEGFLTRSLVIGGRRGVKLAGPGDVLAASDSYRDESPFSSEELWTVLQPARLAVLDVEQAPLLVQLPGVLRGLFSRAGRPSHSLAVHRAVSQLQPLTTRVLVLLWYIAHRWGVEDEDSAFIPFRLWHETLAGIVGAQRPSVSDAMKELVDGGLVARRGRGYWRVVGTPPRELQEIVTEVGPVAQHHAPAAAPAVVVGTSGEVEVGVSRPTE